MTVSLLLPHGLSEPPSLPASSISLLLRIDCHIFLLRALNILRGPEFLRTLHLAAVETFADQALFPSKMLIHPTTLAAFTRLRTITKFEVLPIMGRIEGTEVVTQMKMMPTPSPSMKSEQAQS